MQHEKHLLSFLVSAFKENNVWTLYNWLNTENVEIFDTNHPMYRALENGRENEIDLQEFTGFDDDLLYFTEKNFITKTQNDIRNIVKKIRRDSNSTEDISITLMPVNQACNFRCVYCHEDHTQNNFMGLADIDILTKYLKKNIITSFRSDYFGGEPLLNTKFIFDFQNKARSISNEKGFHLESSSMTTNGYLLSKDLFLKLLNHNITTYQITLDGLPQRHNSLRPLATGGPTFDVIYSNLKSISEIEEDKLFSITIRMNYNYATFAEDERKTFLEKLHSDFGKDKRFIIMVQPISNWKHEPNKEDLYIPVDNMEEIQLEFEKEIEDIGLDTVNMVLFSGPESHSCYSGKNNNFVVYPYDRDKDCLPVEKCTQSVSSAINKVGTISSSGEFHRNDNWDLWTKDTLFSEDKCKTCFFVVNCFSKSCSLKNNNLGRIVCPREKKQEIDLVKRILKFIGNG